MPSSQYTGLQRSGTRGAGFVDFPRSASECRSRRLWLEIAQSLGANSSTVNQNPKQRLRNSFDPVCSECWTKGTPHGQVQNCLQGSAACRDSAAADFARRSDWPGVAHGSNVRPTRGRRTYREEPSDRPPRWIDSSCGGEDRCEPSLRYYWLSCSSPGSSRRIQFHELSGGSECSGFLDGSS